MSFPTVYRGSKVAVTGVVGTIGRPLVRKLIEAGISELHGIDNNESALFEISESYSSEPRFKPHLADIRDAPSMERLFRGVDYVFHTAAYKHVPMCEISPFSAVATNVNGVENVIRAAQACDVKRVLLCSSDKAVNPTNVMGSSKLLGERLFTAANNMPGRGNSCIFMSTRFGNVAGSSGSVIPTFARQIAAGGPVTLTSSDMTRFIMTIDEAASLLMKSMAIAQGGEVFITRMPAVRIADLAHIMVQLLAPAYGHATDSVVIKEIGAKAGEKNFEELISSEEVRRTVSVDDFLIVQPPFSEEKPRVYDGSNAEPVQQIYTSDNHSFMSYDEIKEFLLRPDVLDDPSYSLVSQSSSI